MEDKKRQERREPQTSTLWSSVSTLVSPGCKQSVTAARDTSPGATKPQRKGKQANVHNHNNNKHPQNLVCILVNKEGGEVIIQENSFS